MVYRGQLYAWKLRGSNLKEGGRVVVIEGDTC